MRLTTRIVHPLLSLTSYIAAIILVLTPARILAMEAVFGPCPASGSLKASDGSKISPMKLSQLLQSPNGLAKAAQLAGHFAVDGEIRPIQQYDLQGLITQSALIAVGTVKAKTSVLVDEGNDILTKYTFHVDRLLKGNAVGPNNEITFSSRGGCVAFANGTTAEISTVAWRYIDTGQKYLVFLYQDSPSEYGFFINGGVEGLGRPLSQSDGFEIAADTDKTLHHLVSDREEKTLTDLDNKIKALARGSGLP